MRRTFLSILYLNAIILLGINFASCKSEEIEGSYIQLAEKVTPFPSKEKPVPLMSVQTFRISQPILQIRKIGLLSPMKKEN